MWMLPEVNVAALEVNVDATGGKCGRCGVWGFENNNLPFSFQKS